MALTNSQVAPRINAGMDAENGRGSFWGSGTRPSGYWTADRGHMPQNYQYESKHAPRSRPLGRELDAAAAELGGYEGIVFSYATPIALKIAGVWIMPDVNYSATTSQHQWKCRYGLSSVRDIPRDASAQEIADVIAGHIVYDKWAKRYRRGPVARKAVAA